MLRATLLNFAAGLLLAGYCCCINATERSKYSVVYDEIASMTKEVIEQHMTDKHGCITIVTDLHSSDYVEFETRSVVLRISYNNHNESNSCNTDLGRNLRHAFSTYCSTYVVQISHPSCFFTAWNEANYAAPALKHDLQVIFLPSLPFATNYSESVFSVNETDFSENILTVEYVEDRTAWFFEVYTNNFYEQPSTPGRIGSILLNRWTPGIGFETSEPLIIRKTKNLQGKHLKSYALVYPPYANMEPPEGTEVRLLNSFCEFSNCTVAMISDDMEWGNIFLENRTGTGCVGLVYTGQVDFCVGALYAWIDFWPHVEFSVPYTTGELTVVVPKPKLLGGWSTPFLPFDLTLWTSIVVCVFVSTVGLQTITKATYKYAPRFRQRMEAHPKFDTFTDSIIRSIGMLVLQQPQHLLSGAPVRHLFTSLEMIYLVITACYAAELYEHLTVPRTSPAVETIHDLADQNVRWFGSDNAFIYMIRNSDDPKILKATQNFKVLPAGEITAKVESGGYGLVSERLTGGHVVEVAGLTDKVVGASIVMKHSYVQSPVFTYMQKGSPYADRFNEIAGRVAASGLWFRWEEASSAVLLDLQKQQKLRWSTRKVKYPPKVLNMRDLEGVFFLYLIGVSISSASFFFELYYHKTSTKVSKELNAS